MLLLGLATGASAENYAVSYARRVSSDVAQLPAAVAAWSPRERAIAGGVGLAVVAGLAVDNRVALHFARVRSDGFQDVSEGFTHFGDYRFELPLIAGSWAAGAAFGVTPLRKIGEDGAEASFIAAGLINPGIAWATGRALPEAGESAYKFEPFHRGRYSFPSGHTTEAFAMAAVIDNDLRESFGYAQTPLVYSAAAAVGVSRLYDAKHYTSDVLLGAAIGWSVGTWVAHRHADPGASLSVIPAPGGVRLAYRF